MKTKAIFKSDEKISVPIKVLNGKEFYVLKHDGGEYFGSEPEYGSIALFDIPVRSRLLMFDFESTVNLQFTTKRQLVMVTFDRADLYQVYRLLTSNFKAQFRLKDITLDNDLVEAWTRWPWNIDFLLYEFKNNPEKTLHFVKRHLPELITVMGIRKIPRLFNEPIKFISVEPVPDELDW